MTPCILSKNAQHASGYCYAGVGSGKNKKTVPQHRLVYCVVNNVKLSDIAGLEVMHKCDVRNCINPDHLVLGTHEDNMEDMRTKGRAKSLKGESHPNSKFTAEQVIIIRALYAAGRHSQRDIAALYGVSQHAIAAILSKESWSHL